MTYKVSSGTLSLYSLLITVISLTFKTTSYISEVCRVHLNDLGRIECRKYILW